MRPLYRYIERHLTVGIACLCAASAVTAESGDVLWKFDLANVSGAFVTVGNDGTIYTVDQDRLWALAPDGAVKWTFEDAGGADPDRTLEMPDGGAALTQSMVTATAFQIINDEVARIAQERAKRQAAGRGRFG